MNTPFKKQMKIITAFLPTGKAYELLEMLHDSGIKTANVHNARGSFIGGASDKNGTPLEEQKEVLTCIISSDAADTTFEKLYDAAEFSKPGTGFMFMENLTFSSIYALPEVGA